MRVADAEGVSCEGFAGYDPDALRFTTPRDWDAIHRAFDARVIVNRGGLKQHSGIWRDLAVRQRRTSVDAQPGLVVEIARSHGLRVPLHERLVDIIHGLEDGRLKRGLAHLDELCQANADLYPDELA
jgi:2-dehydropantoate 2-reductase